MESETSGSPSRGDLGSEIPATDCREAPDPCGTAIANSTNHISPKIQAHPSALHK